MGALKVKAWFMRYILCSRDNECYFFTHTLIRGVLNKLCLHVCSVPYVYITLRQEKPTHSFLLLCDLGILGAHACLQASR
jgi:hypothetical protein